MGRKRDGRHVALSRRIQREFGERLHQCRRARGSRQAALAAALGVSRTSVSNIERGNHRVFLDQVYEAAHALDIDVAALLPPLAEIFPPPVVRTAADDPLPAATAVAATQVAQGVREAVLRGHGPRKRK